MTDHSAPADATDYPPTDAVDDAPQPTARPRRYRWVALGVLVVGGGILSGWFGYQQLNQPSSDFPVGEPITIEPGASVRDISAQLHAAGVVRSETLLYYTLVLAHDPTTLKASTYVFGEPLTTAAVASRLTEGDFDSTLVRFTHIEGERVSHLAERAAAQLPNFDPATFTTLATPHEGTLFPDTYFIPESFTAEELFALLRATYDSQLAPLQSQIEAHPLDEPEIITLASIIEREANSPESMRMVAGILLNRLEAGMPLQADATIEYVLDTPLNELPPGALATELRERASPYNTYLNSGLPPTPIGNPGLQAIEAVLEPTESSYWFYLTAPDGTFHYAETYEAHQRNVARYLR